MKKIILLILFFVAATTVKAQVTDTLAYLQSIVSNKSQFVGQSSSKLIDSLKIQIKFFSPFGAIHYDKNKETSTSFSFYFPQDGLEDFYLTYPKLEIYWQTPLNAAQSEVLWKATTGGWSSTIAAFYANGIIADIRVRE